MQTLTLELPNGLIEQLAATPVEAEQRVKTELAINLYSQGILSHAQACELAGSNRGDFEKLLGQREVVRPYSVEMLEEDLRHVNGRG